MPILTLQTRIRESGRIRTGNKGAKGNPQKLSTFRFTSHNKRAIEAISRLYGGTVKQCLEKDLAGQWEVITETSEIAFYPSPIEPTQYMELWSGGGCQRRCDGNTELLSGEPCKCEAGSEACKPTTRLSVILPDVPDAGVWRLESHGWNAASELLTTYNMIRDFAGRGTMIEGTLALEERSGKVDGKTTRFMVPVIRVQQSPRELLAARTRRESIEGYSNPALAAQAPLDRHERPALEAPSNGHVVRDPNPRGAAFATMHEMGLPPHEEPHKAVYYEVLGKVIGRELTSLSALSDDDWRKVVSWLSGVKDGSMKMPAPFKAMIEEQEKLKALQPVYDDVYEPAMEASA